MEFDFEFKNSKFESFYKFLKRDGLVAVKSERLHKKKIYSNLINDNQMTIENFQDFLEFEKKETIKNLIGKSINFDNTQSLINDISFFDSKRFKVHTIQNVITINIDDYEIFKEKYLVGE